MKSLHHLADEIKEMDLTPNKIIRQYQAIEQYIDYTGKSGLADQYEPSSENEYEKKRYSKKLSLKLIVRALVAT